MNLRLITVALTILTCCCRGQNPPTLSDSDAKKIIEKTWNENFSFIPLGQLTVIGGLGAGPNRKLDSLKREISQEHLRTLRILEQMGVIALKQTEDVTKHFTWENWMATTQNGVQLRILVTAGARADTARCTDTQQSKALKVYGDTNALCALEGQATVERVVQNESRAIGVDHYRAILGTHRWILSPIMQEYYARAGQEQKSERKFMVALKYDAFDGEWRIVAGDVADRDNDFKTQAVNTLFAQKQ